MSINDGSQFKIGDEVILGRHQEVDIDGKYCSSNWVEEEMDRYVGMTAIICDKFDPNIGDKSGSYMYLVNIDDKWFAWRGINMTYADASAQAVATVSYGINCSKCGEFYSYAVKVDNFVCYSCRH